MINAFTTKRLEIAPWSLDHTEAFYHLTQDEGFNAYQITNYRQESLTSARLWIEHAITLREKCGLGKMGIWEKETGSLIGMGGLTPWSWDGENLVDLTYRIKESSWGVGYGSEAAFGLTAHAFMAVHLKEITATITPDNEPSKKIASRLGMKFVKRILLEDTGTDLFRLPKENFQI